MNMEEPIKDMDTVIYADHLPPEEVEEGISSGKFIKGKMEVNKKNTDEAFLQGTSSKTIFINGLINRNRAIHGDEVAVELNPENQSQPLSESKTEKFLLGKVVAVLNRCSDKIIATVPEKTQVLSGRKKRRIMVVPYDLRFPKIRVVFENASDMINKRCIVTIDDWPSNAKFPNGRLTSILGNVGCIEVELLSLILVNAHDYLQVFSSDVINELSVITDNPCISQESGASKRKDIRESHLIFTIDPKECEDVDDALSVKNLPGGNLEIGVHIADVSYFIKPDSKIDLEAKRRGTSIYFPDRRYDMLPNLLSANICSLLGNKDRFAVSILWHLDSNCHVKEVWYGRTIIKSSYKLCYETAQKLISNHPLGEVISYIPELHGLPEEDLRNKFEALKHALSKLENIANILHKRRVDDGALDLTTINMKYEIDKNLPSLVSDIRPEKELPVHKVVEELMIYANHWVAKKIYESFPNEAVLRRHPYPKSTELLKLQGLAHNKGFLININSSQEFSKSLETAVDENDPSINQVLKLLAIRAMNQATYFCAGSYNKEDVFHYGLALKEYTHFTSPIRRYADLIVHRLLLAAVGETDLEIQQKREEIEDMCKHLNERHKAAQELEAAAKNLFLCFYLDHSNSKNSWNIVDSVIFSFISNGLLVFIPQFGIKGAVYLRRNEKVVIFKEENIEWTEGVLNVTDSSLIVKADEVEQKYSIFDHVMISMKIVKSKFHEWKISFDFANKKDKSQRKRSLDVTSEDLSTNKRPGVKKLAIPELVTAETFNTNASTSANNVPISSLFESSHDITVPSDHGEGEDRVDVL